MSYATEVDSLVAIYATIGREQRLSRGKKLARVAMAVALVMGAGVTLWQSDFDLTLEGFGAQDANALQALTARVETELGALTAARADLLAERDRFAARIDDLEATIVSFDTRYASLEARQATLAAQSAELEYALDAVDRERSELLAARERGGAARDEALAAIGEERPSLESRRVDFAGQSAQLSLELDERERRRRALETERANAEKERAQLEAMLESAGRGVPRDVPAAPDSLPVPAPSAPELNADADADAVAPHAEAHAEPESLVASLVSPSALADLRAGFVTDGGVNIAIGLTRTASINGEEIVSNSLNFASLGAALRPSALEGMSQLVVQNGSGNWLSPNLDGVPNSFFGTIVQNTRDNQHISTSTVYDVSIQDVGSAVRGFSAMQALGDSLMMQR
jgi:hypothetical protein